MNQNKWISKTNQAQKDKYYMISLACIIYKAELVEVRSRVAVTRGKGK
jgi:hypothetical protein